jgi:HEAT repeat protein
MARRLVLSLVLLASVGCLLKAQENPAGGTYRDRPAEYWTGQLGDDEYEVRWRAAYALAQIGPPARDAVPVLVGMLQDRPRVVSRYALYALGRIGPGAAAAVPQIVTAMQDPDNDSYFRHIGARALGRIGPLAEAGQPLLLAVIEKGDPVYRVEAALALWRISRHEAALPALIDVLQTGETHAAYQAAMALLEFGPQAAPAIPALVEALDSEDPDVRRAAVKVLGTFGQPAVKPIADALAAGEIHPRAGADALGLILDDIRETVLYNPQTSREEFLDQVRPLHELVVPVLGQLLSHPQAEVRIPAALALARLGPSSVTRLLSAMGGTSTHSQQAASEALGRLEAYLPDDAAPLPGVEEVKKLSLPALMEALQNNQEQVRQTAVRVFDVLEIGSYGRQAAPLLRQFLRHEDVRIRRHAARSLARLEEPEG